MTWQEEFDLKFWHLRPIDAQKQIKEFIEQVLKEKEESKDE